MKKTIWHSTDVFELFTEQDIFEMYREYVDEDAQLDDGELTYEMYKYAQEIERDYWETMFEGAKNLENILIIGTLGLWNGKPSVHDFTKDLQSALSRPINDDIADFVIYFETDENNQEHLYGNYFHHDGTNSFEFLQLTKEGVSWFKEHEDENFRVILEQARNNNWVAPITQKEIFN